MMVTGLSASADKDETTKFLTEGLTARLQLLVAVRSTNASAFLYRVIFFIMLVEGGWCWWGHCIFNIIRSTLCFESGWGGVGRGEKKRAVFPWLLQSLMFFGNS